METEIEIRGYPARKRLAEWQRAGLAPDGELPVLSAEQKRRAASLRVPERSLAVAIKAGELARDYAFEELERVAAGIAGKMKQRDPHAVLRAVVWDFSSERFEFVTAHRSGNETYEAAHEMDPALVDEVVLGRQGAVGKLIEAAQTELMPAVR